MKTELTKTLNLLLISFILLAFITDQPLLQEYTVPVFARSVCISDINQDGYKDIIVGHKTIWGDTNQIVSYLFNNSGSLEASSEKIVFCGTQMNIFVIKANEDDYRDMVCLMADFTSGVAERYVRIFYNNQGNYSLKNVEDIKLNTSTPIDRISHGDINGDDWQDIIIASNRGNFWGILFSNDGKGFSEPEYHFFDDPILDITCADLTNDNQDEILYTLSHMTCYYSNKNDSSYNIDSEFTGNIKAADFNGDGRTDFICMLYASGTNITLLKFYKNLDNVHFENQPYSLNYMIFHDWEVADLNNDQLPDLVISVDDTLIIPGPDTLFVLPDSVITGYRINRFCVYYNLDNFQFSEPDTIYIRDKHPVNGGSTGISLACGDINGDGYTDLAYTRFIGAKIPNLVVLYNNGEGRLTGQDLPTGIIDRQQSPNQALTCYPNPFTDQTTIEFQLEKPAEVSLIICDISGRIIKQIINNQKLNEGFHKYKWNGVDNSSSRCNPVPYFVYLKINHQTSRVFELIKY